MTIRPDSRPRLVIQTDSQALSTLESGATPRPETVLGEPTQTARAPDQWIAAELVREIEAAIHPWDAAHGVLDAPEMAGLEAAAPVWYIEPDFEQSFPHQQPELRALERLEASEPCQLRRMDRDWPTAGFEFGWHLNDNYTQLRSARVSLGDPGSGKRILIGILDTGYDPGHSTLPLHLRNDLARNFTGDGPITNATDPGSSFPLMNPGHGTATLAILAGRTVQLPNAPGFDDLLGGAPFADVVPIRIADSVVHFRTSAMAKGIEYAANIGCQVLSISMGGAPTQFWADAVNKAYEKGMCIFAAAGNRIGPSPPATLVYPARFGRVVGVCGFTADKTPYFREGWHRKMHGSFGPPSAMKTAMAAFTPNIPWAAMGCQGLVNPDGAGTSSATPQCAAAATLWLQKHLPNPAQKWRIVEAVRHALFSAADRTPMAGTKFFANGLLRAREALDVGFRDDLPKTPADTVSFPWLRLIGALESANEKEAIRQKMFETEALQLYLQTPSLQRIAGEADPHADELGRVTLKEFVDQMCRLPTASRTLRGRLQGLATRL